MLDTQETFDYEQLSLDFVIENEKPEEGGFISPDEAARISEAARIELERNESKCPWLEDYQFFRGYRLTWRMAAYIAWRSSRKENRWPKTQMLLATEILGLKSDRVIIAAKKKNPLVEDIINICQAHPLLEYRRDAFEQLIKVATKEGYKGASDRKTYFTMTGDYVPRTKIEVKGRVGMGSLKELPNEELERLARPLLKDRKNDDSHSAE